MYPEWGMRISLIIRKETLSSIFMPGPKDHVPRMGYENLSHHKKRGWLKSQPQILGKKSKQRKKTKKQRSSDRCFCYVVRNAKNSPFCGDFIYSSKQETPESPILLQTTKYSFHLYRPPGSHDQSLGRK